MVDYRIQTSWFGHRKRRRLRQLVGDAGEVCLFRLWSCAAMIKSETGHLGDLTRDDIEAEVEWSGELGAFVDALLSAKLLDEIGGEYWVHDWDVHNPWCAGSEDRSLAAKAAANIRWAKVRAAAAKEKERVAALETNTAGMQAHATRNAESCAPHAPRIDPQCPISVSISTSVSEPKPVSISNSVSKTTDDARRVVESYRQRHPGKGRQLKPGHKDWKRIESRLAEGYTTDDLIDAIAGNASDEWHQRAPAGHTIEYIFRNCTKVEGFIAIARGQVNTKKEGDFERVTREALEDHNERADLPRLPDYTHQTPRLLPEPRDG